MYKHLLLAGFLACMTGCGVVYSPSLHLPERPLAKNDGQVTIGYGAINDVNGSSFNDGNDLQLRYAYSDHFSMTVKGWTSTSLVKDAYFNGGFLTNAIITFNDKDEPLILGLIPTWNLLFNNDGVKASGASLQAAVWLPKLSIFRPYMAAGPGLIVNSFSADNWGYGLISNFGLAGKFAENFTVSGEISPMVIHKINDDEVAYLSLGAMVGVSWNFHNQ